MNGFGENQIKISDTKMGKKRSCSDRKWPKHFRLPAVGKRLLAQKYLFAAPDGRNFGDKRFNLDSLEEHQNVFTWSVHVEPVLFRASQLRIGPSIPTNTWAVAKDTGSHEDRLYITCLRIERQRKSLQSYDLVPEQTPNHRGKIKLKISI